MKASYGVQDVLPAVVQLAQTAMRAELGKVTLDKTFEERGALNRTIVSLINEATSGAWGVDCLRYEMRDITPPPGVQRAMEMQAEAERRKRATILDSEGAQQSVVNRAQAAAQETVLASEAALVSARNTAAGAAVAVEQHATALAQYLRTVGNVLGGEQEAAALRLGETYVNALASLAERSQTNTLVLPGGGLEVGSAITQALGIFGAAQAGGGAVGAVESRVGGPGK